jgi:uncharacterized protein (TIGR03382 family)
LTDLLASLAFALLVAGWTQRRRRRRHVPLVLAGIGIDLGLVVYLELTRSVVEKVAGAMDHVPFAGLRWAHIASSTVAVLLYLPTLWYGWRMLRGPQDPRVRRRHAFVAQLALVFRTIGFLCMWAVEAAAK